MKDCLIYVSSRSAVEGHQEQENTLNQLLVEMDGELCIMMTVYIIMQLYFLLNVGINPLEGVVMLASTNHIDILNLTLLRPERFDRQISINLPTLPERKAIFEIYLEKILLEKSMDVYSSRLAALTPGHRGKHYNYTIEPERFLPGEIFFVHLVAYNVNCCHW